MTIEELERGFELHEKRLDHIEETLRSVSENLLVQGELLNRVDQRLDRLTTIVESHTNQLAVLQSAMTSLFQRMDAFIRGLERGNGDALPNQ